MSHMQSPALGASFAIYASESGETESVVGDGEQKSFGSSLYGPCLHGGMLVLASQWMKMVECLDDDVPWRLACHRFGSFLLVLLMFHCLRSTVFLSSKTVSYDMLFSHLD